MIGRKYTLNVLRVIMENDVARFNKIVNEIGGSPKTIGKRFRTVI
jgi:DNA-binding HxlR family transcriptional regulator